MLTALITAVVTIMLCVIIVAAINLVLVRKMRRLVLDRIELLERRLHTIETASAVKTPLLDDLRLFRQKVQHLLDRHKEMLTKLEWSQVDMRGVYSLTKENTVLWREARVESERVSAKAERFALGGKVDLKLIQELLKASPSRSIH